MFPAIEIWSFLSLACAFSLFPFLLQVSVSPLSCPFPFPSLRAAVLGGGRLCSVDIGIRIRQEKQPNIGIRASWRQAGIQEWLGHLCGGCSRCLTPPPTWKPLVPEPSRLCYSQALARQQGCCSSKSAKVSSADCARPGNKQSLLPWSERGQMCPRRARLKSCLPFSSFIPSFPFHLSLLHLLFPFLPFPSAMLEMSPGLCVCQVSILPPAKSLALAFCSYESSQFLPGMFHGPTCCGLLLSSLGRGR